MRNAESILAFDRKGSSLHAHYILLGLVKMAVMLSHSFLLQRVRGLSRASIYFVQKL